MPSPQKPAAPGTPDDGANSIALVSEEATVHAAPHVAGQVRVDIRTDTVEELVSATLTRTDVTITRHEMDRMLAPGEDAPRVRTEANVTIIPILEERLVVERRSFLKAELHLTTTALTEEVATPVSLRRQRAEVTRTPAPGRASD